MRGGLLLGLGALSALAAATPAPQLPPGLVLSSGLGVDASSQAQLPLAIIPTSAFASGACTLVATPVTAMASGWASSVTFSIAQSSGGLNVPGVLLAVYPDANGSPGYPPLLDALFWGYMLQSQNFGSNRSTYAYPNNATWWERSTYNINWQGGTGLGNNSADNLVGRWNAHHGRGGFPVTAGSTYWVAIAPLSSQGSDLYFVQADSSSVPGRGSTAGGVMTAVLPTGSSCPNGNNKGSRWMATFPYTPGASGGLTWAPSSAYGAGLAVNFCTSAAAGGPCMDMPGVSFAYRRRLGAAPERAMPTPIVPRPRRLATAMPLSNASTVPGLAASTGLSWAPPMLLPNTSTVFGCALVASPVVAATTSTIAYIGASVSVTQAASPWKGWYSTKGAPYPPGLVFGVYADASGAPGALLWSARFAWNELSPVTNPARTPGAAYWRPYNTFSVNLTNITSLPPLTVTAGSTYWLAIAGSGRRNDSTANHSWDFMQASPAQLPDGYGAKTAVLSTSEGCNTTGFPLAAAAGGLLWVPANNNSASPGGPALTLCDATTSSACLELPAPPSRVLLPGTPASAVPLIASSGLNSGTDADNAIVLPNSYSQTGCALLAAPVQVRVSGSVASIVLSVADASSSKASGMLLGIYEDAAGTPGRAIWTAFIDPFALTPVFLPSSGVDALDDWRIHNTVNINIGNINWTTVGSTALPNALLTAGGTQLYLQEGETVWVAFGAGSTQTLSVQEAINSSALFPGYSVQKAVLSSGAGCGAMNRVYPSADTAPLVWTPDTSVTSNGIAINLCASSGAACLQAVDPSSTPSPSMSPSVSASTSSSASSSSSVSPTSSASPSTAASSTVTATRTPSTSPGAAFVSLNISLAFPATGADAAAYSAANLTAILLALKCDLANISHVSPASISLNSATGVAPALSSSALGTAQGAATAAGAGGCAALAAASAAVANGSASSLIRRRALSAASGACSSVASVSSTLPLLVVNVQLSPSLADAVGLGVGPGASVLAAVAAAISAATPASYTLSTAVWTDVTCASYAATPFVVAGVASTGVLNVPAAVSGGLSASQQLGLGLGVGLGLAAIFLLALLAFFAGDACCGCCGACCRRPRNPTQAVAHMAVVDAAAAPKGAVAV